MRSSTAWVRVAAPHEEGRRPESSGVASGEPGQAERVDGQTDHGRG